MILYHRFPIFRHFSPLLLWLIAWFITYFSSDPIILCASYMSHILPNKKEFSLKTGDTVPSLRELLINCLQKMLKILIIRMHGDSLYRTSDKRLYWLLVCFATFRAPRSHAPMIYFSFPLMSAFFTYPPYFFI